MPFTFAHPAASIPLRRLMGRWGSALALAIGSMTPDAPHFLPVDVTRDFSHSWKGLLYFDVPVGLVTYCLVHLWIWPPVLDLLPPSVARRVAPPIPWRRFVFEVPWVAVILSLFVGGGTHLAWDLFTHDATAAVEALPFLKSNIATVAGHHLLVYRLLQHGSTLVGMSVIVLWMYRWHRSHSVPSDAGDSAVVARRRNVRIVLLVVLGIGLAHLRLLLPAESSGDGNRLPSEVVRVVVCNVTSQGIILLAYCSLWQLLRRQAAALPEKTAAASIGAVHGERETLTMDS